MPIDYDPLTSQEIDYGVSVSGDSRLHSQVVVCRAEEKASSDRTADAGIRSMSKAILNMMGYWCFFFYVRHEWSIVKP